MSIILKTLFWLLSPTNCYDEEMSCTESISDDEPDNVRPAKMQRLSSLKSCEKLNCVLEASMLQPSNLLPIPKQSSTASTQKKRPFVSYYTHKKHHFNDVVFTCWVCRKNIPNSEVMYCCNDKQFHKCCLDNVTNMLKTQNKI